MLMRRWFVKLSPLFMLVLGLFSGGSFLPATIHAAVHQVPAPPYTTSWYKSTLSTSSSYNEGCAAAKGNPGIVVLDFGEPAYQNGTYGTIIFDQNGTFASDSAIYNVGAAFVDGAAACDQSSTKLNLSMGTSNYNGALGSSQNAWYSAGVAWAGMVNQLTSYATKDHHLSVSAADDIEVEWASYTLTVQFVNGYNATTHQMFVDYGDDSGGVNPSPWTATEIWYVTTGAADDAVIPEIYYKVDATQDWQPMDIWSCQNKGQPLNIIGTMAENGAGGTNTPNQAWHQMYNAMGSNSCTKGARSRLIYSTNIHS